MLIALPTCRSLAAHGPEVMISGYKERPPPDMRPQFRKSTLDLPEIGREVASQDEDVGRKRLHAQEDVTRDFGLPVDMEVARKGDPHPSTLARPARRGFTGKTGAS